MTYAEHDLQAFRDRVYVTTGARLTLTDAAVELDRIRGVYGQEATIPLYTRMADDYFQPVDP